MRLETDITTVHGREQLTRGLRTIGGIDRQHRFQQGEHRRWDIGITELFHRQVVRLPRPDFFQRAANKRCAAGEQIPKGHA